MVVIDDSDVLPIAVPALAHTVHIAAAGRPIGLVFWSKLRSYDQRHNPSGFVCLNWLTEALLAHEQLLRWVPAEADGQTISLVCDPGSTRAAHALWGMPSGPVPARATVSR